MPNKKQIASNIASILFCISPIVLAATLVIWWKDMDISYVNLFSRTRFETKNFIIDLSNSSWIGYNRNIFLGAATTVKGIERKIYPVIFMFEHFGEKSSEYLERLCGGDYTKTVQVIDDWEAEVYSCIDPGEKYIMSRFIVYKGEALVMDYDIGDMEAFQVRYDEFFKRIKLK